MSIATDHDQARLQQLNQQYIEAVLKADVNWYRQHLADDFVCIDAEATVLDKEAFLQHTSRGPYLVDYKLENVKVRIYGETALVQATGLVTRRDGVPGMCRYTDIYVRSGNDWKVVSAQITRSQVRTQPAG
jgi:ketosteroid isomerase-like protein